MYKKASVSSVLALLVAFVSTGEEVYGSEVKTYFVRATKYYYTDINCDSWTLKGYTSTRLRLSQNETMVRDPKKIGNVAVDPRYIPEGSLVFETQTKRFFVTTTGGSAVIDRRSAIKIADKQNLGPKFSEALVFDFYFPEEITKNHYTDCLVVTHQGKKFRTLDYVSQQKRLQPDFWLTYLKEKQSKILDRNEKEKIQVMITALSRISSKNLL
jgi:3D (Asp-Asp-Asp) domain-containing protein